MARYSRGKNEQTSDQSRTVLDREWDIVFDPECEVWFRRQEAAVRRRILVAVGILKQFGPALGRPQVDHIEQSTVKNLKELRVQIGGDPWRILFAFNNKRQAVMLVGGNKRGDKRWYETNIPIAEARAKAQGL